MSSIEEKRETLAHLLAQAILQHYPNAWLAQGAATDSGFYYDIDFVTDTVSASDLHKIEESMRRNLPRWKKASWLKETGKFAAKLFSNKLAVNPYKAELIQSIMAGEEQITIFMCDDFFDICHEKHSDAPAKDIAPGSFGIDRISGAYWLGNEGNSMLTRIHGLAFDTKNDLDHYLSRREEVKKRDHRKIGKEQGLFVFSDLVGTGLPMFTPKGNIVRSEIIKFSRELNAELGFGEVHTPNINKAELFEISGHYEKYKDDMLSAHSQYVRDKMFLKPMNCPQHTQIYAAEARSYRDLPIRYSDFSILYRDERPGELSGLTRLRSFSQDDGHIFCREDQIEDELLSVLSAIVRALATYKIKYWVRLSLRDSSKSDAYIGADVVWRKAESIMKDILMRKDVVFKEAPGEAAFYGPKMDIIAVDAIGREWQISTVQLDFNMSDRFGLEYVSENGKKKAPVMIHRALIGSPERFMGILIEHYAGALPTWLAPEQVRVLPVSNVHAAYSHEVEKNFRASNIRIKCDGSNESIGKRIRAAKKDKIPYIFVVGDSEVSENTVSVESRDFGRLGAVSVSMFLDRIRSEIVFRK